MYPDFLGIGAQKAGTSWLHQMLRQHPQVWLPHAKEIHYFDHRFPPGAGEQRDKAPDPFVLSGSFQKKVQRRGLGNMLSKLRSRSLAELRWDLRYHFGKRDDRWYASLFEQGRGLLTGDITPAYSALDEEAVKYIHGLMPGVRVILLLRDPIERAWSHALMGLGKFAQTDPENIGDEALLAHFSSFHSRRRGAYVEMLEKWERHFAPEQIFVGFFDDIADAPESLLRAILEFLGVSVEGDWLPSNRHEKVNPGDKIPIPPRLKQNLARMYLGDLEQLAARFGGHPQQWLDRARTVLA